MDDGLNHVALRTFPSDPANRLKFSSDPDSFPSGPVADTDEDMLVQQTFPSGPAARLNVSIRS